MSEDELRSKISEAVDRELIDAKEFIETDIGEQRAMNTSYYNGDLFGNEEEGRSRIVSRDVSDTVQALLPSLMRIFFGSERVVEFLPVEETDVPLAEQATDYINQVVVQQDNEGFRQFHSAIKDALVRKVGIFKWWWDDKVVLSATQMTGIDESQLMLLQDDDSIESIEAEMTTEEGVETPLYDATVHRRITKGKARFAAVPSEEFLIDRRATCIEDATLVGHRQMMTVSDIVAMGFDREEVEDAAGMGDELAGNAEYMARRPYATTGGDATTDPMMRRVMFVEAFTRVQISPKADDPAQLLRVSGLGLSPFKLLHFEPVDEIPFSDLCPDPEPHAFFGSCPADKVRDIQLIKSAIWRGTLDSMTLSMFPRTEIVDGRVNMDDLLNAELGGVVRVEAPGMMREIKASFIGGDTLPLLGYVDKMREDRTKQSQASQGLDADALQSTTKAAVSATITGAQAQIELIARIFAETGVKRLFKGLFKLVVRHQDTARMVRLNGAYKKVDPRDWNAEMDVIVNVALGAGSVEERIQLLGMLAGKQELVIQAMGPQNPLSGLKQYRETLAEILKLSGRKDMSRFLGEIPDEAPPQGEKPKDPAEMLAQAQMAEAQMKQQIEEKKLALEERKMLMEDARERYKIEVDAQVKLAVAEAQHKVDINEAAINAQIEAMHAQTEQQARQHEAETDGAARGQEANADVSARQYEADAAAQAQVNSAPTGPAE